MKEKLSRFYIKYKRQIVPGVFISLSFFIIFGIIIPQVSSISEENKTISAKQQEVDSLAQTLRLLSSLNKNEVLSNLSTTTKTLPTGKDISLIFTALTSAVAESGVNIRDFSLRIGRLYGKVEEVATTFGVPEVEVIVRVSASSSSGFVNFSKELQKRLPLSEIKKIDTNGIDGAYELSFYYKPHDISKISSQTTVTPLSQSDLNLINQLREWEQ